MTTHTRSNTPVSQAEPLRRCHMAPGNACASQNPAVAGGAVCDGEGVTGGVGTATRDDGFGYFNDFEICHLFVLFFMNNAFML